MIETLQALVRDLTPSRMLWSLIEIVVVAYLIYQVLLVLKGTRAIQILAGLLAMFILFFASKEEYFNLPTLNWLLDKFLSGFFLLVVVLFQNDIRRGLAQLGRSRIFRSMAARERHAYIEEVIQACVTMASRHLGAIIAIQRTADLSEYATKGTMIDSLVSQSLLLSIFLPDRNNPLHDGAVIIRNGRLSAAGCFLPLTLNPKVYKDMGTRHRAAIGLSEEGDAVVIVASEERGTISVALDGRIARDIDGATLRKMLQGLLEGTEDFELPRESKS
ncbi:MAG: TIGR00159 family protein [Deltaproteobacteria bacterium]|nr:TIGR00159 family protein [Deltaproteobacteria bacterium]